ncbi:unnamed protein product [Calypogeia fissa]
MVCLLAGVLSCWLLVLTYPNRQTYAHIVKHIQAEEFWSKGKQQEVTEEAKHAGGKRGCDAYNRPCFGYNQHGAAFCTNHYNQRPTQLGQCGRQPTGTYNYCGKLGLCEVKCELKKIEEQITQLHLRAASFCCLKPQAHLAESSDLPAAED